MNNDILPAPGAKFSVQYTKGDKDLGEIEGVFRGVVSWNGGPLLAFDTDSGRTYLSAFTVIMMRQIEAAPEEPKKNTDGDRALYG